MRLIFKIILGFIILIFGTIGFIFWVINRGGSPSPVSAINPQSSGPKALVISNPGISDFESKMADAFARSLASNGWHVEVTTVSSQTPTDLTGYSLLVLSAPIYGGMPSPALQAYMGRLNSLNGIKVVSLMTSGGKNPKAMAWMTSSVQSKGGNEVLSLAIYSMSPNDEQFGTTEAQGVAAGAAASLSPLR